MSARWLRLLIIPVAVAALLVPGIVTAKNAGVGGVIPISSTSPFADDPDCHELGAEGEHDAEAEVTLAVDPTNPEHIVVAWMQDMYDGIVTNTSEDGGETWSEELGVPPGLNGCSGDETANPVLAAVGDPDLSIGPDDREGRPEGATVVYLVSFTVQGHGGGRLQVSRSFDGGSTWEDPVVIEGSPPHHDRPSVAADPYEPCRAYLAWDDMPLGVPGIWFSETEDCGESWSSPSYAFGGEDFPPAQQPQLRVLPGGDLLVTAVLRGDRATVIASRSEKGSGSELTGREWSEPVEVAGFTTASSTIEDPDPDPGQNAHTVYTEPSWAFLDVAPDGTAHVAFPNRLEDEQGREIGREIRVARSTDGGQTWEKETLIASPEEAVQPFIPTIAVAGDGTVGLTYYDTRNDGPDDEPLVTDGGEPWIADLFFAHSIDGGRTWQERHVAGPIDLRTALTRTLPDQPGYGWIGDYNGTDGLPHGFAAAFALSQPVAGSGASDIFFTKVCRKGAEASGQDRDDPCHDEGRS